MSQLGRVSFGRGVVRTTDSLSRAVWNTIRGSLGNLVEWYDVYAYTVFVTYFEAQFFDQNDKNSHTMALAVFALTFVMRPIGSWFFGRWADRHGRRSALTFSVSLMALASFLISILPTKSMIGIWAVLLLMGCRLIQGFATGGEYGTSATYMSEAATRKSRGFLSSFQYVTLVGGHVLAQLTLLILTGILTQEQLKAWGWRIPFFIGGISALIVFWLRRSMDESLTPEHLADVKEGRDKTSGSMKELLTKYWWPLLLCFLVTLGGTVAFYTYSVNAPSTIKATFKTTPTVATWINLGLLVFLMLLQPVGGWVSDKVGRKPLLVFFGAGGMIWTYVLIHYLPGNKNIPAVLGLVGVAFVFLTGYTSINALVKAELFPAHIRALGVGLGYGLANAAFGGTAPMVYDYAKNHNAVPIFIGYVTVCIAISLLVYIFILKNKHETHLDREQGHAFTDEAHPADAR